MVVLKNNFNHCNLNDQGMVSDQGITSLSGLYFADVRLYQRYEWLFTGFTLLQQSTRNLAHVRQMWSMLEHHFQAVSIERDFSIEPLYCYDRLTITNHSAQPQNVELSLLAEFDHQDTMTLRGIGDAVQAVPVKTDKSYRCVFSADHSRETSYQLRLNGESCDQIPMQLILVANQSLKIEVTIQYQNVAFSDTHKLPQPKAFESDQLCQQNWADLSGLLFAIPEGVIPAAGLPRFVCPFGRDSLLTAFLMLDTVPEIAEGSLGFLAKHIGTRIDLDSDEEPGKILHEYRWGPESQQKHIPFAPYYGSADATPLFVWLWSAYSQKCPETRLTGQLLGPIKAALHWILKKLAQGDGFIRFRENAKGLKFHGWKDSPISMCHQDGRIAGGDIAVVEVQGYAFAALTQVQTLLRKHREDALADRCARAAAALNAQIQEQLWDEELAFYVMGLDGDNLPMRVVSSNMGHLLWAGAVPLARQGLVRDRLFQDDMWSGWGFRTLSEDAISYNPVSYHNGSIWPHDTAVIALGLNKCGFKPEAAKVAQQLRYLAASQPDGRLPELVAGYSKAKWNPPIPYPGTCSPQAWAAAALLGTNNLLS
mgnify:CR=1 FL=1|jgi:glycogen debranching enzyme